MVQSVVVFCLVFSSLLLGCACMHESYNFALAPAKRICFYEDFDDNTPLKIMEVFVESGGSLDVLLTVHGPLTLAQVRSEDFEDSLYEEKVDSVKESDSDTSTFTADLKPSTPGTYGICLDNRNAHFLTKHVQLDVRSAKPPAPVALHIGGEPKAEETSKEDNQEAAVTRVKEALERIRKGIKRVQVQQQVDRHRLQLHGATRVMENNRVVTGSIVETIFFVAAALFQIFFVRRWFASRNSGKSPKESV